jgi:hypothetical protein
MDPRSKALLPENAAGIPVAVSYSGGTSSKWLVYAVLKGFIPRPAHFAVFFADTGAEHNWTYADVDATELDCRAAGVPFFRCSRDHSLVDHLLAIPAGVTRRDTPPMWVAKDGGGMGRVEHRCTREFKVAPMRRAQTKWLKMIGQPKRIEKWIGFGADEIHRAIKAVAKQDVTWEEMKFPAIRLRVGRAQQRAQLAEWGVNAPKFSMCVFCPWKDPARWHATPEDQRPMAIAVDEAIRDCDGLGITDGQVYLSKSLTPLATVFSTPPTDPAQFELFPDLSAGCEGGHCFL